MRLGDISGFPDYSSDADSGLIFSHKSNKFLAMHPNNKGYGRTHVSQNGKQYHLFNHIKVVEVHGDVFGNTIPPFATTLREIKMSIDHLNSVKMDPRQCNLELVLHSENIRRYQARDADKACEIPDL